MNESPNYHSLNTCAQDWKPPERLSLLTIFMMMSVIALDGISNGRGLWSWTASGQQWVIFPPRCSNAAAVPPARAAGISERASPGDAPKALCPFPSC